MDKQTFKMLFIVLIAISAILLIVVLSFALGIPAMILGLLSQGVEHPNLDEEETGAWGHKEFEWTHKEKTYTLALDITNDTYKENNAPLGGKNIPEDLINYKIINDADNAVYTVSKTLQNMARENGFDDAETVSFVMSFVQSISYQTDMESGHTSDYPRTPVVTLAEQTGDSEDLSILATSILEDMGYASCLLYYPLSYDRKTLIPDACAIGLPGTSINEPFYTANTTYTQQTITFHPSKANIKSIPSGKNSSGWYWGNGYDNNNVSLGMTTYVPQTGEYHMEIPMSSSKTNESTKANSINIENATWSLPVKAIWAVDTNEKGIPVESYNAQTPVIIQDDALWYGKEAMTIEKERLNLELTFDLGFTREDSVTTSDLSTGKHWNRGTPFGSAIKPVITVNEMKQLEGTEVWREKTKKYQESSWYSSGIAWNYNSDHWKLHDKFLTIDEIPSTLYTPSGTAEYITQSPWRIAYSIEKIYQQSILDKNADFMTPYADLCIAVYKIQDNNSIELVEITGWQGHSKANTYGTSRVYSPGKYAIGIFSRNVIASVDIEFHGKEHLEPYLGGI